MKLNFLFIAGFLFVTITSVFSQTEEVDSLFRILPKMKEDTNKVNALNILTEKAGWFTGNNDTALYFAKRARKLAEKINFNTGEAKAYNNLAITYTKLGSPSEALTNYFEAVRIYKKNRAYKEEANGYNSIGNVYFNQYDYTKALEFYQKSLKIRQEIADQKGIIASLNNIGNTYLEKGDMPSALEYQQKGLSTCEAMGNKELISRFLLNIGRIYEYIGDPLNALEYYQKSSKISYQLGDSIRYAHTLLNIGNVYETQSDYEEALSHYFQSLNIYKVSKLQLGIATALGNIGTVLEIQGQYENAKEHFLQSLIVQEEIQDKKGIALNLNRIGLLYVNQSNYPKATEYFNKALKIQDEIDDKQGKSRTLNNFALIYNGQGDLLTALDYMHKSLKVEQEIGDNQGISTSFGNIGILYEHLGDSTNSLKYHRMAIEMKEVIGDKQGIAQSYNSVGNIYMQSGNFFKAKEYYQKSLAIFEEIGDNEGTLTAFTNIGFLYKNLGEYSKAIENAEKAFVMGKNKYSSANTKPSLHTLITCNVLTKKIGNARSFLTQLTSITHNNLKTNYFHLSDQEKAKYSSILENDFEMYHNFTANFHDTYTGLLDTAYNIALTNKGLALKSSTAMRSIILKSGDTTLVNEYNKWIGVKLKINKAYEAGKETKELELKANEMERSLVKMSTAFSDFEKLQNLDWKQVRETLKPGEAAVEFVHFKDILDSNASKNRNVIYAAYVVKKESPHPQIVKLCNERELIDIIGKTQGNNFDFVKKVYGTKENQQTLLYEKVWGPLEPYLKNVKTIFYSPTGLLHKISFAALRKDKNSFLCDAYQLHQLSSTGILAMPSNIELIVNEDYALVGGIEYNTVSSTYEMWPYLPGTLSETQNINVLLQKKKQNVFSFFGDKANEQTFKQLASKASIVHIATHGFFYPDPEEIQKELNRNTIDTGIIAFRGGNYVEWSFVRNKNPLMRSGVVLAGANEVWNKEEFRDSEDGILTAAEVSNLDMRKAKLVVLSACETGLGDIKGSEGVFGLQRSFKMAGVANIIMSLWQVPDKETSEFMHLFYIHLLKLKNIKKAFIKTQKAMRAKYEPYYWGAFVLIE